MTLIEDWSMRGPSKFNDEALLFGGDAGGVAAGGLLVNPNHRGIRDPEVLTDSRGSRDKRLASSFPDVVDQVKVGLREPQKEADSSRRRAASAVAVGWGIGFSLFSFSRVASVEPRQDNFLTTLVYCVCEETPLAG